MKRHFLEAVALIALVGLGSVTPAQEFKGPKGSVDQLKYHFGKVVQGEQAEHVFELRSVGNETLIIDRIQSS